MRAEYWVMRVMLHQGTQVRLDAMTPGARVACEVCIGTGTLVMLGDGAICEPVEVFAEEPQAHEHRRELLARYPSADFRVVLNADVTT